MKVVTFFNNKGGVGKTTLAVNIAAYIRKYENKKILFLDADPQSNATQMVIPEENWEKIYSNEKGYTLKDIFEPIFNGDPNISEDIKIYNKGDDQKYNFYFDLILGHPEMSANEDILSNAWQAADLGSFRKTNWLYQLINKLGDRYDILFIDVGPSLGALNRSILLNSHFIVTPMGSDVFSLMGISNIGSWIQKWRRGYELSLENLKEKIRDRNLGESFEDKAKELLINLDFNNMTKLCGYSIQQYNARKGSKYKDGRRPVKAYDAIISQVPEVIEENLNFIIPQNLKDKINLGDVPYLNSIIPLSQSNNTPLFDLNAKNGIRGSQIAVVTQTRDMIGNISNHILENIGEID